MIRLSNLWTQAKISLLHKSIAPYISNVAQHTYFSGLDHQGHYPIGSFVYMTRSGNRDQLSQEQIQKEARSIFEWAKSKGAERYSFISYPHTNGISQKQDSFINLNFTIDKRGFKETVNHEFKGSTLIKGEGDGSSFPSGGLRHTHLARAYMLWDINSHLYVRRRNNTLYIPSLLISHDGKALDNKTLYRMSEQALEKRAVNLLKRIGIDAKGTKMLLGLEQEFFVIPKEAYEKRVDLKWLGRTLVGTVPARNQQLGDHYYAKIPSIVEKVLNEVEQELLEIGIPFKTRHNEVALNQFEISCIYDQTGITIDQNIFTKEILEEAFSRHGYTALFHEKPFKKINGSGKHANWNLSYIKKDGTLKNLFKPSEKDTAKDILAHKLFMLIQLSACLRYHKLYLASIANPGNEIRLGGHEAPPRIFSVFLGTAVSNFLDGKEKLPIKNLKEVVTSINFDVYQQDTDRNRTSPFAFTGNKFEFRAVGASQNAAFPLAVIAASIACEIEQVIKKLDSGQSIENIISQLHKETLKIRFEGNGYSRQWRDQAKRRGLYVNENFVDLYKFLDTEQEIFTRIKVSTPEENASRAEVAKNTYNGIVKIECDTLIYIARRHIIPHAFNYLKTIRGDLHSNVIIDFGKDVQTKLEQVISGINKLEEFKKGNQDTLDGCQKLRVESQRASDLVTNLIKVLPRDENFPDLSHFLSL